MEAPKVYVNGKEERIGDFKRAKELLIGKGLYGTLSNFGPYFPKKEKRIHKKLETFIIEDMEYTIIESETISLSLSSLTVSNPHMAREAWYQTV